MSAPSRQGEELGIKPGRAVAEHRHSSVDALDFFPTPPWATRALVECVLPALDLSLRRKRVWEPAAGEGHMAEVLREYTGAQSLVIATDVHDYGRGYGVGSFVGEGPDVLGAASPPFDWVITNPPFNLAIKFAERALKEAPYVALLVRTAWLEGGERYARLFSKTPPLAIAQFAERVPMTKGRWDPGATTATAYCWVVWDNQLGVDQGSIFTWIPPGQRQRLSRPDDIRFAGATS